MNTHIFTYKMSDAIIEEGQLLRQLEEEAILYSNNGHTPDELAAAVSMMLMHYQDIAELQNTPRDKTMHVEQCPKLLKETVKIQDDQEFERPLRLQRPRSSLLATCRNILKEFLGQNSI